MRYLILVVILFISCGKISSKKTATQNVNKELYPGSEISCIVDTSFGDTTTVSFVLSGIEYNVHYYKNKPQYIRINKFKKRDSTILSYERDNQGIFIGLNDSLGFLSFGSKYLSGNEIINCHLDSIKRIDYLEINNNYYRDTPFIIAVNKIRH